MELVKSIVNFELDKNGTAVAGNIERVYSVTDASGTYQRAARDVLSAADLAALLPDQGALTLELIEANRQKAKAEQAATAAEKTRDEALSQRDTAALERDAAIEARQLALTEAAVANAERDLAMQERDALAARLEPQHAGGFPILTPVQMRRGLRSLGVTADAVAGVIAMLPDEAARINALEQWEYALGFERAHPLVVALGAVLGLDPGAIDAAWNAAAQQG